MKTKSLLFGILVGGIAGSTIALLTAPKSGQDLKRTLYANSQKVKDALITLKTESNEVKNQIIEVSKESASILKDGTKDIQTSIEAWKKDIEPNKAKIYDELKNIESTLEQLEKMVKK